MSRRRFYWRHALEYQACWRRFRDRTMQTRRDYVANLFLVSHHLSKRGFEAGSIVECGTWAGGMSFGMMAVCPQIKEFHCFDSFEGLPEAQEIDGSDAVALQRAGQLLHDNNRTSYEQFLADVERFRRPDQEVHVHKGWFSDTMPGFRAKRPIAALRLDCDWYDSMRTALEHLFDQVMDRGLVVIDDYYHWDGCSRALHDFLSARRATERIRVSEGGVVYLVRSAAQ